MRGHRLVDETAGNVKKIPRGQSALNKRPANIHTLVASGSKTIPMVIALSGLLEDQRRVEVEGQGIGARSPMKRLTFVSAFSRLTSKSRSRAATISVSPLLSV